MICVVLATAFQPELENSRLAPNCRWAYFNEVLVTLIERQDNFAVHLSVWEYVACPHWIALV